MTGAVVRRVENRLERMVRPRVGGITAGDALAAAAENLRSIEDACRQELDARLEPIRQFTRRDPRERPSEAELADLVHHVDRALTACGALNLPLLGKALILLSAMADALSNTSYWPEGALTPAINLIALLRDGALPAADGETLLRQLNLCLNQYLLHAEAPTDA